MHADAQLVVDFLNTVDVEERTDVLDDANLWQAWAASHALDANPGLRDVRLTRDRLRATIGDPRLTPGTLSVPASITLTPDGGPALLAGDVLGAVLAAATRLTIRGEWPRLKICPASDCLWAFYDESRNRSRAWCSMRVCGNREKARAWRARAAEPAP